MTIQGDQPDGSAVGGPLGQSNNFLPFPVFVLLGNANTVNLNNLIIQFASAPNPPNQTNSSGGGIYDNVQLTMNNCIVHDCFANFDGGGLYATMANLTLNGCSFLSNTAMHSGGAIYFQTSGPQIFNGNTSTFNSNVAMTGNGGAIFYTANGQLNLTDCGFNQNSAFQGDGGAICAYANTININAPSGSPVIINNKSGHWGGAIWVDVTTSFSINEATDGNFCSEHPETLTGLVLLGPNATASFGPLSLSSPENAWVVELASNFPGPWPT